MALDAAGMGPRLLPGVLFMVAERAIRVVDRRLRLEAYACVRHPCRRLEPTGSLNAHPVRAVCGARCDCAMRGAHSEYASIAASSFPIAKHLLPRALMSSATDDADIALGARARPKVVGVHVAHMAQHALPR